MGIIKGSLKLVGNVVTLGGVSRLEDAQKSYQKIYDIYKDLYDDAKSIESKIHDNINEIGTALKNAKKYLDKGESILTGTLRSKTKFIDNIGEAKSTLTQINKFQEEYNSISSIGAGVATGSTMAIGSWTLVSTFGAASTGTAIAQLSGVAASNATLAWFGGGSLAAGGAGISGGAFVLGGIVAIPLVVVAAKSTHNKAKEVEDEAVKIEQATTMLNEQVENMKDILPLVEKKKKEANNTITEFTEKVASLGKIIRPWGFLSLIKQKIYIWLEKNPYSEKQKISFSELNSTIANFLVWFRGSHAEIEKTTSKKLLTY